MEMTGKIKDVSYPVGPDTETIVHKYVFEGSRKIEISR
jgi:hypothetical protein